MELMGPMSAEGRVRADAARRRRHEVEKVIQPSAKKEAPPSTVAENAREHPQPVAGRAIAKGESLAEYAAGSKVVVNNDLSKAKGKLVEMMIKRGAKSSLHVPAEIKGQRVTVNFWSTEPNAFTPPAEALLTGVAKIMTAPKDNAQAAAK